MSKTQPDVLMTFNCRYYPRFSPGEVNSQVGIVDPSGYIPPKERIENLIRAGERLDSVRREMYHYGSNPESEPDEDDGVYEDPMLAPGLDIVDVHRLRRESMRRLADQAYKRMSADNPAEKQAGEVKPSEPPVKSVANNVAANEGNAPA